ncbi:hypothetical protein L249_7120 [Ophiocordyceps polyrhachis-furcata BCC 54312]|uniref:Elongator complex protein 4 n=1 Tax=Ophiocordyceps polyrhachis-furcata BCC 54312 TaxID=1330021 RepID=A0A367LLF6_9HYPO|nr:hypothetical protein L249_7120 [Ophiocordyceps polyrhachis-furcata BCC 54312]
MAFRRRNQVIHVSRSSTSSEIKELLVCSDVQAADRRKSKTSTGTPSLDQILSNQRGLSFGTSLLIEETGNTDYGGVLSRYFAAEGLVQGHAIHFHGLGDIRQELPGLVEEEKTKEATPLISPYDNKMRIAWRYENTNPLTGMISSPPNRLSERVCAIQSTDQLYPDVTSSSDCNSEPFCHSFTLSRRLGTAAIRGQLHTSCPDCGIEDKQLSDLKQFLSAIESRLRHSSPLSRHRILIPSLLSPAVYRPESVEPQGLLQLIHGVRSLLRQFPTRAVALVTIPISLYPRSSGLIRWAEILFDGTIEIDTVSSDVISEHERGQLQGVLRIHSLPIIHESGGDQQSTSLEQKMLLKTSVMSGVNIQPSDLSPTIEKPTTDFSDTGCRCINFNRIVEGFTIFCMCTLFYTIEDCIFCSHNMYYLYPRQPMNFFQKMLQVLREM